MSPTETNLICATLLRRLGWAAVMVCVAGGAIGRAIPVEGQNSYQQTAVQAGAATGGMTWAQVKARFESSNPILKEDQMLNVDEAKAAEITAYLRPNPQVGLLVDGTQLVPHNGVDAPLQGTFEQPSVSYLHERDHKRELRLESAQEQTRIGQAGHADLERNLMFNLRTAFVATLQAKAVLALARADLEYYDRIIDISRDRLKAGDIAQIDFDRIDLARVQYETEIETAIVNLRTAKIQLLQMLDERTPVDQFDVQGTFDFQEEMKPLSEVQQMALNARPDLQQALQTVEQAKTNHQLAVANGSTDPTFGAWYTHNASTNNVNANQTLGLSVNVPLRIFDRNQGEKQRTQIDIDRSRQLEEATRAQIFADVDSAYEVVRSNIDLLKPYKATYLAQSVRVRDTVTYSYLHGGASLMDFLNAQSDYRQVQFAYLQLVGAYMTAAGQLNLSVGQEVMQ